MLIANFKEYMETLRSLFAGGQKDMVDAYAQDMAESGRKQKAAKEKLQREISLVTAKINQLRLIVKNSEDKKSLGLQIKRLKRAKEDLVRKIKQRDRTSRFAVLNDETKTALCTLTVLRKFLTKEILENEFLGVSKDENGNIVFSRAGFENSQLYQDALHIRDYIAAYIMQNQGQVVSESYFNRLFDKESGWRGICQKADKFFEDMNKVKKSKSRAEIIAESRSDLEQIKSYQDGQLILVRLKTPEALDYEGRAAHCCVGGGTFDKLLDKAESGIYSLRRLTKDGELKPVVTIELNGGEIKQVRGVCNSIVPYDYSLPARDASMILLKKRTQDELVEDKKVSENVLNNLGLYRNPRGGYLDIHNLIGTEDFELPELVISADGLDGYEWDKLKIKSVRIVGKLQESAAKYLNRMTKAQVLTIENLAEPLELNLNRFDRLQNLNITSADGASCILRGKNGTLAEISISNVVLNVADTAEISGLKNLIYTIGEDCALDVSAFRQLENLTVKSKNKAACLLQGQNRTLQSLDVERLKFLNLDENSFPSLKSLECTYVDSGILSLSLFPVLEKANLTVVKGQSGRVEGNSETLVDLQANNVDITRVSAPNLRKLTCNSTQVQDLDISYFPNLESFSCSAETSDARLPLGGIVPKLAELNLRNVSFEDMTMRRLPALENVSLSGIDLRQSGLKISDGIQFSYQNCIVDEEIVKSLHTTPAALKRRDCHHNKVEGTHFDFSEFSECISLDGLTFGEARGMKFAPKVKTLMLASHISSTIKIEGLNEVEGLIFTPYETKEFSSMPLIRRINPQTLQRLDYLNLDGYSDFNMLQCTNLKELQGGGFRFSEIPPSVERLIISAFMPMYSSSMSGNSENVWDFSRLVNVRDLSIHTSGAQEHIVFPANMEKLDLSFFLSEIKELDFSHCHRLKELEFSLVAPKLKRVALPDSIEILQASRSESGIGVRSDGFEKNEKLKFEIPSTARPEIIEYLREQWGDDRVRVIPQQTKMPLSVLLLQKTNKRLK